MLFIKTENSMDCNYNIVSEFVRMEINFAKQIFKPIYSLNLSVGSSPFQVISHEMIDNQLYIPQDEAGKLLIRCNHLGG